MPDCSGEPVTVSSPEERSWFGISISVQTSSACKPWTSYLFPNTAENRVLGGRPKAVDANGSKVICCAIAMDYEDRASISFQS